MCTAFLCCLYDNAGKLEAVHACVKTEVSCLTPHPNPHKRSVFHEQFMKGFLPPFSLSNLSLVQCLHPEEKSQATSHETNYSWFNMPAKKTKQKQTVQQMKRCHHIRQTHHFQFHDNNKDNDHIQRCNLRFVQSPHCAVNRLQHV